MFDALEANGHHTKILGALIVDSPVTSAAGTKPSTIMASPTVAAKLVGASPNVVVGPGPVNSALPAAPGGIVALAPVNPVVPVATVVPARAVPVVLPAPVVPAPIMPALVSDVAGLVPAVPGNTIRTIEVAPAVLPPVPPATPQLIKLVIPPVAVPGPNTNTVLVTNGNSGGAVVTSPVGGSSGGNVVVNVGNGGGQSPAGVVPSQKFVIGSGSAQTGAQTVVVGAATGGNALGGANGATILTSKRKPTDPCAGFTKYCKIEHDLVYSVLGPHVLAKCGHVCLNGGAKG